VRDEGEVVGRVDCLGLCQCVDGEVERGELAEALVDELLEGVGGMVLVQVEHKILVDELDGVLVKARYAAVGHELDEGEQEVVVLAQDLERLAAHLDKLLEEGVGLFALVDHVEHV